MNYKLVGQYLVNFYLEKRGRKTWTPTTKEEARIGHVNIQSRASLRAYSKQWVLRPNAIELSVAPSRTEGTLKRIVSALRLWEILSPPIFGRLLQRRLSTVRQPGCRWFLQCPGPAPMSKTRCPGDRTRLTRQ